MLIVITGKGGVGKTMVSALLVKAISSLRPHISETSSEIAELKANEKIEVEILAVDADPVSNFAFALGIYRQI